MKKKIFQNVKQRLTFKRYFSAMFEKSTELLNEDNLFKYQASYNLHNMDNFLMEMSGIKRRIKHTLNSVLSN